MVRFSTAELRARGRTGGVSVTVDLREHIILLAVVKITGPLVSKIALFISVGRLRVIRTMVDTPRLNGSRGHNDVDQAMFLVRQHMSTNVGSRAGIGILLPGTEPVYITSSTFLSSHVRH